MEDERKEALLNNVEKEAEENEKKYRGCSRSCLLALQRHFSIGDSNTIKASTPLAAGIAFKGETCGALLAGIMALGLITATDDLEDQTALASTLGAGYKLYNRFVKEMGTSNCFEIQRKNLGRSYNLADPKEYEEFQREGGYNVCSKVVGQAARLTAQMILELREKIR